MVRLPTDRFILQCIFDMYKDDYPGPKNEQGKGTNDPYIGIDLHAVSKRVGMSPELLFGRLYFHLDQKHRYKQSDNVVVSLFQIAVGDKRHAVQFPYLASLLADQNREFRRYTLSLATSFVAIGLSVASLMVSLLKAASGA